MAHKLIGSIVEFTRPVIVKAGFRRLNEETDSPEEVPAKIEMQTVPAFVIGVEPQAEGFPRVHLAFMDPTQLHHIGGSGWRDAFSRVDRVRPGTHPHVEDNEHVAYYMSEEIYRERYENAMRALQPGDDPTGSSIQVDGAALPPANEANPDLPPPPPPPVTEPTPIDAVPAPATGRTRRKPGEPA